ncbi:Tetratricopeptide repeat-containing protein [Pustulibacterium marinum]|uniref:Tetratricopeptide repeat-containing protein n=1 Tax=Pustulibacterium marinum TaxID=1224947 RepID=A0A1I7EU63_9FLAO|nr:tetratricopeptide repeat protein [Pustulibacterium marinum]SFU27428.1 Tetratricopeptide repeat-containing protein [Pustulibacterium marinum]
MIKNRFYIVFFLFCVVSIPKLSAQNEDENADVTTEQVEDAFQENFFEAMRERAIENYDKAIDYLKKCKELDPENATVDFQLGRNYYSLKSYEQAENYFLAAIEKDPDNRWFSEALLDAYQAENKTDEAIEVAENLAQRNDAFKKTLVLLYARSMDYDKALKLLDELDNLYGTSSAREKQRMRYKAFQKHQAKMENEIKVIEAEADETTSEEENPVEQLQQEMSSLLKNKDYKKLLETSDSALESYPSQSIFYFMNGVAHENLGAYNKAISSLENALSFLIDDIVLEKQIYAELAACHKKLGNLQKEQEYLQKAKNI